MFLADEDGTQHECQAGRVQLPPRDHRDANAMLACCPLFVMKQLGTLNPHKAWQSALEAASFRLSYHEVLGREFSPNQGML